MEPRHTARGIVIHDGKLLLIERHRAGLHYYSVPGGGIELGETPEQTCLREITEETSCSVKLLRPLYILQLTDGTRHHIFSCAYKAGEPRLPADSPEALQDDPNNRFEPTWLPLAKLQTAPFLVWQPVKQQLLHDMQYGFSETVVTIWPE